jgi:putative intracellular protease/amidase
MTDPDERWIAHAPRVAAWAAATCTGTALLAWLAALLC